MKSGAGHILYPREWSGRAVTKILERWVNNWDNNIKMAQIATIDQMSGGRAGLNVVCGWNKPEYEAFDWDGEFFTLKNTYGNPRPVRNTVPISCFLEIVHTFLRNNTVVHQIITDSNKRILAVGPAQEGQKHDKRIFGEGWVVKLPDIMVLGTWVIWEQPLKSRLKN